MSIFLRTRDIGWRDDCDDDEEWVICSCVKKEKLSLCLVQWINMNVSSYEWPRKCRYITGSGG